MRRIGNLLDKTASRENVIAAVHESLKRRTKDNELRRNAERFLSDFDNNVDKVCDIIRTGNWTISHYRSFTRVEHGKVRKIDWNPSFIDNVIQHALYQTVGVALIKTFISDTYSGIKNRGGSYGLKRLKKFLFTYSFDEPIYVLKIDIHHFYPSIDIEILKALLQRKIKDKGILKLLFTLIDSHPNGLPIGNFLSQLLANFYLSEFDHYIKEQLGFKHYVRYCDDIVVINNSKEKLKDLLENIKVKFATINLTLKPNHQVYPIKRNGIDFMGYVFHRSSIILRKRIERAFRKAAAMFNFTNTLQSYKSIAAYNGWVEYLTKGHLLWNKLIGIPIDLCFEVAV